MKGQALISSVFTALYGIWIITICTIILEWVTEGRVETDYILIIGIVFAVLGSFPKKNPG